MEKEITTPDYYPLSLNALMTACNQKSNRDPVMELNEDAVRDALDGLESQGLAGRARGADSRVTKYEHRLAEAFNFDRRESAILCVLLLRGAQTPGELRGRTERMYHFEELAAVESSMTRLAEREPPLVKKLPRQPGMRESRYMHLLCGEVEAAEPEAVQPAEASPADDDRLARLEGEVAGLRAELAELRQQLAGFRKQFE